MVMGNKQDPVRGKGISPEAVQDTSLSCTPFVTVQETSKPSNEQPLNGTSSEAVQDTSLSCTASCATKNETVKVQESSSNKVGRRPQVTMDWPKNDSNCSWDMVPEGLEEPWEN